MFLKQSHQQVSGWFDLLGRASPLHPPSSIILAGWGGRNRTFKTASLSNGPFTGTDSKWCMHFKIPIQSNKYALRVLSPCNTCFQQNTVLLTGGEELPGVPVHHLGLHQHVRRVSRCTDQPPLLFFLDYPPPTADDEYGEKSVSVSLDGQEAEITFIDHPSNEMSVSWCGGVIKKELICSFVYDHWPTL